MVVLILMGVCGCGKTTIAQELATRLNCPFKDADDFHCEENKRKMNQGIPLTDQDRTPWLCAIHDHIQNLIDTSQIGVVTCSALKQSYRDILLRGHQTHLSISKKKLRDVSVQNHVLFIYLKGEREVIKKRLQNRFGHFMSPTLLDSQLKILEEPQDPEIFLMVNVEDSVEEVVNSILDYVNNFI